MRVARRVLGVVAVGAVLVAGWHFAARNGAAVQVDLLGLQLPETPLWLGLLAAFAVGAAASGVVCLYEIAKLGLLARRYRKSVARLESEIHQLRNLPLAVEAGDSAPLVGETAARAASRDG